MRDIILDLIESCDDVISAVKEIVNTAYDTSSGLAELDKENDRLRTDLGELLSRNCSLRKKDFNQAMEGVLSDLEARKGKVREGRQIFINEAGKYLGEQKEIVSRLREYLVKNMQEEGIGLERAKGDFKSLWEGRGECLLKSLHGYQRQFQSLKAEYIDINNRLKRLIDRGESLRVRHLRQLEANKARRERKEERKLRQQDVERLLSCFRQSRATNCRIRR